MSGEASWAAIESFAAVRVLLLDSFTRVVALTPCTMGRLSGEDSAVIRRLSASGERHSISRFVRMELAWFQGGRTSSPTKQTLILRLSRLSPGRMMLCSRFVDEWSKESAFRREL